MADPIDIGEDVIIQPNAGDSYIISTPALPAGVGSKVTVTVEGCGKNVTPGTNQVVAQPTTLNTPPSGYYNCNYTPPNLMSCIAGEHVGQTADGAYGCFPDIGGNPTLVCPANQHPEVGSGGFDICVTNTPKPGGTAVINCGEGFTSKSQEAKDPWSNTNREKLARELLKRDQTNPFLGTELKDLLMEGLALWTESAQNSEMYDNEFAGFFPINMLEHKQSYSGLEQDMQSFTTTKEEGEKQLAASTSGDIPRDPATGKPTDCTSNSTPGDWDCMIGVGLSEIYAPEDYNHGNGGGRYFYASLGGTNKKGKVTAASSGLWLYPAMNKPIFYFDIGVGTESILDERKSAPNCYNCGEWCSPEHICVNPPLCSHMEWICPQPDSGLPGTGVLRDENGVPIVSNKSVCDEMNQLGAGVTHCPKTEYCCCFMPKGPGNKFQFWYPNGGIWIWVHLAGSGSNMGSGSCGGAMWPNGFRSPDLVLGYSIINGPQFVIDTVLPRQPIGTSELKPNDIDDWDFGSGVMDEIDTGEGKYGPGIPHQPDAPNSVRSGAVGSTSSYHWEEWGAGSAAPVLIDAVMIYVGGTSCCGWGAPEWGAWWNSPGTTVSNLRICMPSEEEIKMYGELVPSEKELADSMNLPNINTDQAMDPSKPLENVTAPNPGDGSIPDAITATSGRNIK